jgi:hypothetical protein
VCGLGGIVQGVAKWAAKLILCAQQIIKCTKMKFNNLLCCFKIQQIVFFFKFIISVRGGQCYYLPQVLKTLGM